jgi:hypothetical protein
LSRDDRYRAIRSGISMSYWPSSQALELAARKWRALAERRRAHFVELYHSGRWKRYYSEEQFLEIAPSLARPSTEVETAASTAAAAAVEPVRTAA